jgi:hypothetical protein
LHTIAPRSHSVLTFRSTNRVDLRLTRLWVRFMVQRPFSTGTGSALHTAKAHSGHSTRRGQPGLGLRDQRAGGRSLPSPRSAHSRHGSGPGLPQGTVQTATANRVFVRVRGFGPKLLGFLRARNGARESRRSSVTKRAARRRPRSTLRDETPKGQGYEDEPTQHASPDRRSSLVRRYHLPSHGRRRRWVGLGRGPNEGADSSWHAPAAGKWRCGDRRSTDRRSAPGPARRAASRSPVADVIPAP